MSANGDERPEEPLRYAIEAFCFESRFVLKELRAWLPEGAKLRPQPTLLVAELGADQTLYAFDFGALVFVNVPQPTIERVVAEFERRLQREPHPPLREDFALCVDATRKKPEISFDAVTVPALSPLGLECVATVLAQSVTIDYYDEDLSHMLREVGRVAQELAKSGGMLRSRRAMTQLVGRSIASQVETIASISLLDKPDFTWDDEDAERLYDVLRHHLEIQERYRALESKLGTVRSSLSQFLELQSARRSFALEALVVLLILFEIVLSLSERLGR